MADLHHFVPRVHLRMFSDCPNRRRIGLYNFKSDIYIEKASLRHQAGLNNFYESKFVEEALAEIEAAYGSNLKYMIEAERIPHPGSDQHMALLQYITLQRQRIPSTIKEGELMLDASLKGFLMSKGISQQVLDTVVLKQTHTQIASILAVDEEYPLMKDLEIRLLRNETGKSFFTSDVPVIFYNQLFEKKSIQIGGSGIGALGFQAVFPISPTHALLLYDPSVYNVRSQGALCVIKREGDVENINKLQVVNARNHLYFPSKSLHQIRMIVPKYRRRREDNLTHFVKIRHPQVSDRKVEAVARIERQCRFKLSFISIRPQYIRIPMYDGEVYLRPGINPSEYV